MRACSTHQMVHQDKEYEHDRIIINKSTHTDSVTRTDEETRRLIEIVINCDTVIYMKVT